MNRWYMHSFYASLSTDRPCWMIRNDGEFLGPVQFADVKVAYDEEELGHVIFKVDEVFVLGNPQELLAFRAVTEHTTLPFDMTVEKDRRNWLEALASQARRTSHDINSPIQILKMAAQRIGKSIAEKRPINDLKREADLLLDISMRIEEAMRPIRLIERPERIRLATLMDLPTVVFRDIPCKDWRS